MSTNEEYLAFLKKKAIISESFGFEPVWLPEIAKPHQKDICDWTVRGGRRAIFASFGLGKTFMQLINAVNCIKKENKPFLIACPLGVVGEFKRDNQKLGTGYEIQYITDTEGIESYENKIYLTNYERIRKGDIDPSKFSGVSFDEASILRNLKTETTNYILSYFKKVPYRFVATATPSPNDFIELLNYADYLGVASRGHLLTRFFKRNSTKAGDLQLLETKKKEFWQWVSTWAVFINKPSDLGYDDIGYDLPKLNVIEHCVEYQPDGQITDKYGNAVLFKDNTKSLVDASREKRDSIEVRVRKTIDIISQSKTTKKEQFSIGYLDVVIGGIYKYPSSETLFRLEECSHTQVVLTNLKNNLPHVVTDNVFADLKLVAGAENYIFWHHLEDERRELEFQLKWLSNRSVFGAQKNEIKEKNLIDFSNGEFQYLTTKPEIAGSGCNFQGYCNNAIFVGINYKFNDFIQAVHRIYRYGQDKEVNIHIIYTQNEQHVLRTLNEKWAKHNELQQEMISLVKEYGLNTDLIRSQMERQVFNTGDKIQIGNATLYNNDNTVVLADKKEIKDNSVDLIVTSIPFGDHYEYSDFYNDYGHNNGNLEFFKQMDFLTPNLLRVLKPGHICAVHVKDRIRYSYQNGTSFTTIEDFSGETVRHFVKHGFYLMGKITVTTDVVAENNQTYRLGWSEQCKDATKMGVGLPEYILLFRKAPSELNNAYADEPVKKEKDEYPVDLWQLDAHAFWRCSGNRLVNVEELAKRDLKQVVRTWKKYQKEGLYDFEAHKKLSRELDQNSKLSRKFMTVPPISNNEFVWDDIQRTNTLNAKQVSSKKEKHICPLQLEIIERLINRFSNVGNVVLDPFGGLLSTPYQALKMNRKAIAIELNPEYYRDGLFYVKSIHHKINTPTLFDLIEHDAKAG